MDNFDDYQRWTRTTARYGSPAYPQLALAEEVGELLGKLAKFERDVRYVESTLGPDEYLRKKAELRADVMKEAGDVLWQLARLLDDMGISLGAVAALNIVKLESRLARDTINGSGDNR